MNAKESFSHLKDRNLTEVYSIDISKSETQLAVGCKDFTVKVYDNDKRTLKMTLHPGDSTVIGHSNRVHSVKFAEYPNIILSGGSDSTAFIWDLRVGKSIGYLYGPHICGDAIDIIKDTMLTGSFDKDNPLQLWSISKKKLLQNIIWNTEAKDASSGYVNVAKFEKKQRNKYIIALGRTGINRNEVRLFSIKGNVISLEKLN
jgi:WD40 repeat protein